MTPHSSQYHVRGSATRSEAWVHSVCVRDKSFKGASNPQGAQTRVSGLNTAQANQKWLALTNGRSCWPSSPPEVARPSTSQVEPVWSSTN
jgi:hypothetical protein